MEVLTAVCPTATDVPTGRSWYRPNPDFDEKQMSKVALANVKYLKARADKCRKSRGETSVGPNGEHFD